MHEATPLNVGATATAPDVGVTVGHQRRSSAHAELSRKDTDALWRLLAARRTEVTEELVKRFLPLARRLASRYRNLNEPHEDLVQVACVGLLGAIARFDPDRQVPFPAFAIPTILGELKRHFRSTGWAVHVTRRDQEISQKIEQATRALTADGESAPTVGRLAQYLEIDIGDVIEGLQATRAHFAHSLDAPLSEDPDTPTLLDTIGGDDEQFALREMLIDLAASEHYLPHLERQALSLRLAGGLTQGEIAQTMGCSQMQVSRLLRRARWRITCSGNDGQ